jgi:hypothetical protein
MVNDGFPERDGYGFEMVAAQFCRKNAHQSKIYAESKQSDFPRIFAELVSMQTLAIYQRLLVES